ncbi:MAG: YcxB family protein [Sphingobacteriales bacterium]|nr:MAG: YcxB family protein [Sphingobacteriales bacterium]
MKITTTLTEKDFIRVTFYMLYSKLLTRLITGIGVLMLLAAIAGTVVGVKNGGVFQWAFAVFMLIGIPLSTYYSARRNYVANTRISETITYGFFPEHLAITGESFQSTLTWHKVHKVSRSKNWILIWQNAQIANVIPARAIQPSELPVLRQLLATNRVPNNL